MKKEIDKKIFENLCGIQCTQAEICAVLDVDDKTLTKWIKQTYNKDYKKVYEEKKGIGKISLRRTIWKMAETNTAMAIFLAKNYLGLTDNYYNNVELKSQTSITGMSNEQLEKMVAVYANNYVERKKNDEKDISDEQ